VKRWTWIAGIVCVFGIFTNGRALAAHCRKNPTPCAKTNGEAQPDVTLRILRNFLVIVEGQFGDSRERQNFILDTGTAPSIVNASLVKELALTPAPSTMSMIGKIVPAQWAVLPELDVGPIHATALQVQIQDLSALEHNLGMTLAGIVGMDVLGKSDFRLDYDKKLLTFGATPEQGIPVSFDALRGIAVASVKVDGKPKRLLVDTGSDRIALLGVDFKGTEGLGLHRTSQQGSNLAHKSVPVQVFYAPDIVLGDQHFNVQKAYFISGSPEPGFDGLLGVRALGFRALAYNREREAIYLQK